MQKVRLVFQFCGNEVAVQTCDVADRDILRTFGLTSTGVCTVTETEFVHFAQHGFGTAQCFRFALRKQVQLAYLSGNEQHGGTVLTSGYTSTATDTGSGIHGFIGDRLRNRQTVQS